MNTRPTPFAFDTSTVLSETLETACMMRRYYCTLTSQKTGEKRMAPRSKLHILDTDIKLPSIKEYFTERCLSSFSTFNNELFPLDFKNIISRIEIPRRS